jgi:hypothetical protein
MTGNLLPLLNPSRLSDARWRRLARLFARTQFGTGSGSDVVDWAVDALTSGWDSPALQVLAGLDKPPNEFEVDRYVERMLSELGVEMPRGAQVVNLYVVAIARDILAATISPYDGAREMFRVCTATNYPQELRSWVGLEDEYELARDGVSGDIAETEQRIMEAAHRLVGRAPNVAVTSGTVVDLGQVRELDTLLEALEAGMPTDAIVYVEGVAFAYDVRAVLASLPQAPEAQCRADLRGTLWPTPTTFHLPVSGGIFGALRELEKRHAAPEVCSHLAVYRGDEVLALAYDAASGALLVGCSLPDETLKRIRDVLARHASESHPRLPGFIDTIRRLFRREE